MPITSWNGMSDVAVVAAKPSTAVNEGDFMVLVSGQAVPFSSLTDAGTEAANQLAAANAFLGVSMERRLASDATPLPIAIKQFVTMDVKVKSGNYAFGDILVASETADNATLERDTLELKATAANVRDGIAVVVAPATSATVVKAFVKARLGTDSLL
jgi:hypothetical protein